MHTKPGLHMKHFLILFFLLPIFCTNIIAESTDKFDIKGVIINGAGTPINGAKVSLFKIEMSSPPKLNSTLETKTDKEGEYIFDNQQGNQGYFYRVFAEFDGRDMISEPFRQPKTGSSVVINLQLPEVSTDPTGFELQKELLIFEQGQSNLRVTNIINMENNSENIIDLKAQPMRLKLPVGAKNIVVVRRPDGTEHKIENGEVLFNLQVKPGPQQILLSYFMDIEGSQMTLQYPIPEGIPEVEIITPANDITASVLPKGNDRLIEQKKTFEEQTYISKSIQFGEARKALQIKLSGFPTPKNQMVIAAFVVTCLLFAGLGFYLIRNAKTLK